MKLLLLVLISISLLQASHSMAGTWRVEQDGSGDFLILQSAVDVAASGDTILIGPGWYQDMQWGAHGIWFVARWTDSKDLVFIGENVDTVILGPESFTPVNLGPNGIYSDSFIQNDIVVRGITFTNLHTGILGAGEIKVEDCRFEIGDNGVHCLGGNSATIRNCSFNVNSYSVLFQYYDQALVEDCQIERGMVHFETVNRGDIKRCEVTNFALAAYYNSTGKIQNCDVESPRGSSITASRTSNLIIEDCNISSKVNAILASGLGTSIEVANCTIMGGTDSAIVVKNHATFRASGCDIYRYFSGEYVVFTAGYTNESLEYEVDVSGNFWVNMGGPEAYYIDDYIWDQNDDPNNKVIVKYSPIEGGSVPTKSTNWGSVKALFR